MLQNKKFVAESDISQRIATGQIALPPLAFEQAETEVVVPNSGGVSGRILDALLTLRWRDRSFRFAVECKSRSNPKTIADAVAAIRQTSASVGLPPMLIVPFLPEARLRSLEECGVSAIDLCGNGVVLIPGELCVYRTGNPNRFGREGAIKNVYRGDSAVAARAFLLSRAYPSLQELRNEIQRRGSRLTASTISKVCRTLEDDLIIERFRADKSRCRSFRVLQPEKLLDSLAANYEPPAPSRRFVGKCALPQAELAGRFMAWQRETVGRVVLTGAGSTGRYATMAREDRQSFYCTDLEKAIDALGASIEETPRFANLELIETTCDFVYFDPRDVLFASPVQTYLELSRGDKRERETAEQVRRFILENIKLKGDDDDHVGIPQDATARPTG